MPANSTETVQNNKEIKNNRRGRTIFPRLQGIYRCNRATNLKTKRQEEEKDALFSQEKEAHCKGRIDGKRRRQELICGKKVSCKKNNYVINYNK